MPKSNSFKMHPEVVSSLGNFLAGAEGGAKTSVVRNGNSGLTVGSLQIDLSKNEKFAEKLIEAGKEAGLPGAAKMQPSDLMQKHTQIDESRAKNLTAFTGAVLATEGGKAALKTVESVQLGQVQSTVERECAKAGPDAEAFCRSPEGQRELAAYVHQYGPNDTKELGKFLSGESANLNGKEVRLDGPLTVEGFRTALIGLGPDHLAENLAASFRAEAL
ncbi:MAG: hypothetical protein HY059_00965 [Proteobacteria bacterium]|nr:hypothetical protein [Pseudomonadota bacterium]